MKYYIIEDTLGDWNNIFLVKANNKKDALDILWKEMNYNNQEKESVSGYKPHYKKEFEVTALEDYYKKCGEKENFIILH